MFEREELGIHEGPYAELYIQMVFFADANNAFLNPISFLSFPDERVVSVIFEVVLSFRDVTLVLDLVTGIDPVGIDIYGLTQSVYATLMTLATHLAREIADGGLFVTDRDQYSSRGKKDSNWAYILTATDFSWLQKRQSKVVSSFTFALTSGLLLLFRLPMMQQGLPFQASEKSRTLWLKGVRAARVMGVTTLGAGTPADGRTHTRTHGSTYLP